MSLENEDIVPSGPVLDGSTGRHEQNRWTRAPKRIESAFEFAFDLNFREGTVARLTFQQFWPVYVRAHNEETTRLMHCVGTLLGWGILVAAIVRREWWWVALALIVPYALAWISHFFVEHNKPATFEHPLWSWLADQKMVAMMLVGRMDEEVRRVNRAS